LARAWCIGSDRAANDVVHIERPIGHGCSATSSSPVQLHVRFACRSYRRFL
jgi:hypothetical protein